MSNERTTGAEGPPRDVSSGLAIVAGAVASMLIMSHHPQPSGGGDGLARIAEVAGPSRLVHGALVAAMLVQAVGLVGLARGLGLARARVRLGLLAWSGGLLALAAAALVNGFAVPAFAERHAGAGEAERSTARIVAGFGWELNQALSGCGVLALSVGVAAWSLALVRHHGRWRWLGSAGLALGCAGAGAYLLGHLHLDLHGFGAFLLAHAAWAVGAGTLLASARRA